MEPPPAFITISTEMSEMTLFRLESVRKFNNCSSRAVNGTLAGSLRDTLGYQSQKYGT